MPDERPTTGQPKSPQTSLRSPVGWRIDRIPGKPVLHQPEFGRYLLPLWLVRDGEHHSDLDLILDTAQAEDLHAQFCRALQGKPTPNPPRICPPSNLHCPRGWSVERTPGIPLRAEKKRYVLPLWLVHNGRPQADLNLCLSPAEAELVHAQFCRALRDAPLPPEAPECRRTVQVARPAL